MLDDPQTCCSRVRGTCRYLNPQADAQLELSPSDPLPARLTFTYALGIEHGLYAALSQAPENIDRSVSGQSVSAAIDPNAQSASAPPASSADANAGTEGIRDGTGPAIPLTDQTANEDAEERPSKRVRV